MKKINYLVLVLLLLQFTSNAQLYKKGESFPDMVLTDINGKKYDLAKYMDQGYSVVIELGLTTCTYCWGVKEVLNQMMNNYGPNGKVKKGKVLPIFVEMNINNSTDQLHGKGGGTMGDWVTGAKYPIVDLSTQAELDLLIRGASVVSTPAFYFICSDRKVYAGFESTEGLSVLPEFYKDLDQCAVSTTSVGDISNNLNGLKIYPNPSQGNIQISLDDQKHGFIENIQIVNVEGRVVYREDNMGANKTQIDASGFANGMYFIYVNLQDGTQMNQKVLLSK